MWCFFPLLLWTCHLIKKQAIPKQCCIVTLQQMPEMRFLHGLVMEWRILICSNVLAQNVSLCLSLHLWSGFLFVCKLPMCLVGVQFLKLITNTYLSISLSGDFPLSQLSKEGYFGGVVCLFLSCSLHVSFLAACWF